MEIEINSRDPRGQAHGVLERLVEAAEARKQPPIVGGLDRPGRRCAEARMGVHSSCAGAVAARSRDRMPTTS